MFAFRVIFVTAQNHRSSINLYQVYRRFTIDCVNLANLQKRFLCFLTCELAATLSARYTLIVTALIIAILILRPRLIQVNLDMTDSMGQGKLVRHMQNLSYTYDEYLICIGLGPSISSVICKNLLYSGPSYPSSPVAKTCKNLQSLRIYSI